MYMYMYFYMYMYMYMCGLHGTNVQRSVLKSVISLLWEKGK